MTNIADVLRRGGPPVRSVARYARDATTKRAVRVGAVVILGAIGGLIALALAPPVEGPVGPGRVEIQARTAFDGRTEIGIPPLGTLSAKTHRAPVLVNADVKSVDLDQLQELMVAERPTQRLIGEAESDLSALALRFVVFSLVVGLVGGALAGLLASHFQLRRVGLSAVGGLMAVSGVLGLAWRDFDADAMSEPTYSGALQRAPQVIETISRNVDSVATIRTRVDNLGREFAELYALSFASSNDANEGPETKILHVSDIHSNPLAMEVVLELTEHFGIDAILDTGDLTSFGLEIEARIIDQIDRVDVPYLFVPGNHDSSFNRAAMANNPDIRVLRDDVATVNGLRILGLEDPSFTATNEITGEESDEIVLDHGDEAADSVRAKRPDVLAVHNERLARESFGEVPLILTGHSHVRGRWEEEDTIRLEVGSTGAGGVESFMVETDAPYEAQILHFAGQCLLYRDYVQVRGIGGDIQIDRQTFRLTPGFEDSRPTCTQVDNSDSRSNAES